MHANPTPAQTRTTSSRPAPAVKPTPMPQSPVRSDSPGRTNRPADVDDTCEEAGYGYGV